MKITLPMVQSADGKITHGDDPRVFRWSSKEDQQHYIALMKRFPLIVMGSKTYEAAKRSFVMEPKRKYVILTRTPEKYAAAAIPGQLEFSHEQPRALVTQLEQEGYTELLLGGGAEINGLFLDEGLVDELMLTIEPKILGSGKSFTNQNKMSHLKLLDVTKLNEQGTLVLHYAVEK